MPQEEYNIYHCMHGSPPSQYETMRNVDGLVEPERRREGFRDEFLSAHNRTRIRLERSDSCRG